MNEQCRFPNYFHFHDYSSENDMQSIIKMPLSFQQFSNEINMVRYIRIL